MSDKIDLSKVETKALDSQMNKLYERKERFLSKEENQEIDNQIKDIIIELLKRELGKRQGS